MLEMKNGRKYLEMLKIVLSSLALFFLSANTVSIWTKAIKERRGSDLAYSIAVSTPVKFCSSSAMLTPKATVLAIPATSLL